MKLFSLLVIVATLCSCGYHFDTEKPKQLSKVTRLYVPLAKSSPLTPGLGVDFTNYLIDQIAADGRYRLSSVDDADAILNTRISNESYSQVRTIRNDPLRPEELRLNLSVQWNVKSLTEPGKTLLSGSDRDTSRFFVDRNLQTSKRNAYPDAFRRVSLKIVQRLSDTD